MLNNIRIDSYRDGGTVFLKDDNIEIYINGRISASKQAKGAVYDKYPGDDDARKLSDLRNLMEAKELLEKAYAKSEYYIPTIRKGLQWITNEISDKMCPPEDDLPCY